VTESIPQNALVVVADGGKAILFRNEGQGGELSLREEQRLEPATMTQGPSGSRPEEQSPKQTGEATFAKNLAHVLETMHNDGKFKQLVLVADPQTLGQIRAAMHKSLAAAVVRSISKDLTNNPVKEIERSLRAA